MSQFYVYKITHIDRPTPQACFVSWSSLHYRRVLDSHVNGISADPAAVPLHEAARLLDPPGFRIEILAESLELLEATQMAIQTVRETNCIPPYGWNAVSPAERELIEMFHAPVTVKLTVERQTPERLVGVRGGEKRPVREGSTGLAFDSIEAATNHFNLTRNTVVRALKTGWSTSAGLSFVYQQV